MNCKQGDLAIVIKSRAGNEGKIVTCVRLVEDEKNFPNLGLIWEIDTYLPAKGVLTGKPAPAMNKVPDSWLRPIKGLDELEDETNKELELVR